MFNLFKKRRKAKAAEATAENVQPVPVVDVVYASKENNAHTEKAINLHVDINQDFEKRIQEGIKNTRNPEVKKYEKNLLKDSINELKTLMKKTHSLLRLLNLFQ